MTGPNDDNKRIEIIKTNGDTLVMPKLSKYPLEVADTSGAFLPNKSFVICGGFDFDIFRAVSECYKLKNGQWDLFGKLQTTRWYHGASSIGHTIWFTGGYSKGYEGDPLATTEILNSDGTVTWGPSLPSERYHHCQAAHKDTILIIGGKLPFYHYHF